MDTIEILLLPLYLFSFVILLFDLWLFSQLSARGYFLLFGVFAVLIFCFWRRKAFWVLVLAIVVLLASPWGVQYILNRTGGAQALQVNFSGSFDNARVVKYRCYPSSFGDSFEYWKVELADADARRKRRGKPSMDRHYRLGSTQLHPPAWWPDSDDGFMVHQERDYGGQMEIWTPEEGSIFYIYIAKF